MRAIIIAAGKMRRWKNHLGVPKYLIEIGGETLIDRQIRLLKRFGVSDIYLCTNNESLKNHPNFFLAKNELDIELDRFYNTRSLWNTREVLLLFGDTWYSREAMKTIIKTKYEDFMFFGRSGAFNYEGKKWGGGEIFAIKSVNHSLFWNAFHILHEKLIREEISRAQGWELYRQLVDLPLDKHQITQNFIEINDKTNDFDDPKDYKRWISI